VSFVTSAIRTAAIGRWHRSQPKVIALTSASVIRLNIPAPGQAAVRQDGSGTVADCVV
jgi:hypothetical protein